MYTGLASRNHMPILSRSLPIICPHFIHKHNPIIQNTILHIIQSLHLVFIHFLHYIFILTTASARNTAMKNENTFQAATLHCYLHVKNIVPTKFETRHTAYYTNQAKFWHLLSLGILEKIRNPGNTQNTIPYALIPTSFYKLVVYTDGKTHQQGPSTCNNLHVFMQMKGYDHGARTLYIPQLLTFKIFTKSGNDQSSVHVIKLVFLRCDEYNALVSNVFHLLHRNRRSKPRQLLKRISNDIHKQNEVYDKQQKEYKAQRIFFKIQWDQSQRFQLIKHSFQWHSCIIFLFMFLPLAHLCTFVILISFAVLPFLFPFESYMFDSLQSITLNLCRNTKAHMQHKRRNVCRSTEGI